jgi:hypothetical protein
MHINPACRTFQGDVLPGEDAHGRVGHPSHCWDAVLEA